jgi:hypothetical protein
MKIYITISLLVIFALLSTYPSHGQGCGTEATAEQIKYMDKKEPLARSFNGGITRGTVEIPVQLHILQKGDGTGGIELYNVKEAIRDLNNKFYNANIRFVILENISYLNDDYHFDFNVNNEEDLGRKYDLANVVNLYVVNSISSGQVSLCGYAYFPPGNDRVLMTKSCLNNGSTFPHEMGHYFMLYHTHGTSNTGSTDELVSGDNCSMAGDRVCDTPADPNLSGLVDANCSYIGRVRDANNQLYSPDPLNMMSYSTKPCRKTFTDKQFQRMNYAALNHRNNLQFPPKDITNPQPKAEASLSGKVMLEMAGSPLTTSLDLNLFKSTEGYYKGTNYQMFISNDQTAYVYVIGSNLNDQMNLLFPLQHQSALVLKGKKKFALPGEDYMYQMDNVKGKDYVCVLYSKRPLKIDEVMREMRRSSGTFIQKVYKALDEAIVPQSQITYTQSDALEFTAIADEQYIVPIIVEVEHL